MPDVCEHKYPALDNAPDSETPIIRGYMRRYTEHTHTHTSSTLLSPPSGCSRLSSALSKLQLVDLNFKLLVCPTPQADSLAMCVIYIFWHNRRRLFNVCRRHKMTVRPDWLIRTGSPSHAQQKIRADICIICSKGCWQTKIYI